MTLQSVQCESAKESSLVQSERIGEYEDYFITGREKAGQER